MIIKIMIIMIVVVIATVTVTVTVTVSVIVIVIVIVIVLLLLIIIITTIMESDTMQRGVVRQHPALPHVLEEERRLGSAAPIYYLM